MMRAGNGVKKIRLFLWLSVAIAIVGPGVIFFRPDWFGPSSPVVSVQGEALIKAQFSLTDHTGKAVSEATYRGKWLLVFFGFTYCPDVCPTTLNTISGVMDALGAKADQIVPIFITVDPDRDKPATIAEYVGAFHPKLVGLTGTSEQIAAAAKAFRVYYSVADDKKADDYQVNHSGILYFMNPEGKYATHFSHRDSAEKISTTIRTTIGG